jgi:hypothetical protein
LVQIIYIIYYQIKAVTDVIVDDLLAYTSEEFNKSLSKKPDTKREEPPKEVMFHNRQAFGDILTMTCAIRDFKNTISEYKSWCKYNSYAYLGS